MATKPTRSLGTNICFDCERACGDCSWSEIDPDTEKPRFEPVPGWTAEETLLTTQWTQHGKVVTRKMKTYHITACPLFERTPDRKPKIAVKVIPGVCVQCGAKLMSAGGKARFCAPECFREYTREKKRKEREAKENQLHTEELARRLEKARMLMGMQQQIDSDKQEKAAAKAAAAKAKAEAAKAARIAAAKEEAARRRAAKAEAVRLAKEKAAAEKAEAARRKAEEARQKAEAAAAEEAKTNRVVVIGFDPKTRKMTRYRSMVDAGKSIGVSAARISTACMSGKQCHGVFWRKESDIEDFED